MLSTRPKSRQRKLQEGQAIVLIALLLLVLFAMLGLAIDSGRAYVDKRDLQTAVDAAALAAGDWYENYLDLTGSTLPQAEQVFQTDLHLYSGPSTNACPPPAGQPGAGLPCPTYVGPLGNLRQDNYFLSYNGGAFTLSVSATNTQFNGYQFVFTATHYLPLAFMQIFGGPTTATIVATATSIVGNQRQTPALLTLSSETCATHLQGSGSLTVLGDVYTNGTACIDSNLHLAGNCYGQTGSNCNSAAYYCYNASAGFIPYAPYTNGGNPCLGGDILGGPNVPAPTLPDPLYQSPSYPFYSGPGIATNRGSYIELSPGTYNNFSISSSVCFFLDPGIYTWNGGYASHGGLVSNELKAPDEELYTAAGSIQQPGANNFWGAAGCAGSFTVAPTGVPSGNALKHQGGAGTWGIELTSVRYDRFFDNTVPGNVCFAPPGCMRESTPSACHLVTTADLANQGINVTITQNSPGAQFYNVYINPNGCLPYLPPTPPGTRNDFSFVNQFAAPAAGSTLAGGVAGGGWACVPAGVTVCSIAYNAINNSPTVQTHNCNGQARVNQLCWAPDDETAPTCFSVCPPAAAVPQENGPMNLEYVPYTSGDVANENYCMQTPISPTGDPAAPCTTAKITPGAVQFYFGPNDCFDQNGNGYTHVFSGEQYNWIVIYQLPVPPAQAPLCSPNKLDGNALTQYIGTIYTPSSNWEIQGSDKAPLAGQVICWAAIVTGSGQAGIDFNPNYAPAPPAARLIN